LGENFLKKVFPQTPFQKLFIQEKDRWSFCNSGASSEVDSNSEKILRDLVTSAQWDVGVEFLV